MPIRTWTVTRVVLLLAGAALFALACNLTTTPPTPTARPVQPTPSSPATAPTLFASITPLPGFGGVAPTQPPNAACPPPPNWIQYAVEAGDSIGALAGATNSTIQDIVSANCLSDPDTLFAGQVIYLPRSPISG